MHHVYEIKNNINGKIYVGYTSLSIEERFNQHVQRAISKHKKKYPLHYAIIKYGKENFSIRTIFSSDDQRECFDEERSRISKNVKLNVESYNIHEGGSGGDCISMHPNNKAIRLKFSERSKKFWKDEEYRKKLLDISKNSTQKLIALHAGGRKFWDNEENKKKYIEKNLIGKNNPFFGKKHSDLVLKTISEKIKKKYEDPVYSLRMKEAIKNRRVRRHNSNAIQISDKQYYEIVTKRINEKTSARKIASELNLSFKVVYNRLRWIGLA